jgi:hypothetical protein
VIAQLDQLYDLRGQLESAIKNMFDAQEISSYTRLNAADEFQKVRPRLEIKARIGAPLNHYRIFSDSTKRNDMFRFDLALQVVTDPATAASPLHGQMVARVDSLMQPLQYGSQLDYVNFPFITILYLRDTGIASTLKTEEGVEYSVLGYEGHLGIRPDAWPIN